ncbi:MAG: hypothetical protein J6X81_04130 [Muribaculaceae bacterium]|nr:hypothetical protein [Muribaculaceae bacterium]
MLAWCNVGKSDAADGTTRFASLNSCCIIFPSPSGFILTAHLRRAIAFGDFCNSIPEEISPISPVGELLAVLLAEMLFWGGRTDYLF